MHWWEIDQAQGPAKVRAVAYYRHSAQDRQENSIPIQRDQVHEWAEQNGVEIIREFADHGRSGLTAEDRPAFTEMMDEWVKQKDDFEYVLCLWTSAAGGGFKIDSGNDPTTARFWRVARLFGCLFGKPKIGHGGKACLW